MNGPAASTFRRLKAFVVSLLGRDRANRISAPYHDFWARRRTLRYLACLPRADLCIHVGCGHRPLAGWVNLDRARATHVDVVWDLRRGLPLETASASAIFAEHVIEHLTREEGRAFLIECHRVLQNGGVVRLSTPDAGRYLQSYASDGAFLRDPRFGVPAETLLERINTLIRGHGHLWCYDYPSVELLMRGAGFSEILRSEFGDSLHPRMRGLDSPERAFESLYAEARK